jgi:nitrite reductase/ring-hydroxylating ferredoxin subunit
MARVRVGTVTDVPAGEGRVIEAAGRTLALFNVDGTYYALDNSCAHRGGPLGEGDMDRAVVTCPWHGWRWDVRSGANVNNPAVRVACFAVIVEQDALFIEVP